MSNSYFELENEAQSILLGEAEVELDIPSHILEKDIWICWILQKLSTLSLEMTFKGGTSLSKVFGLIHRFSEDVDITIDYRHFKDSLDLINISRSQLKKVTAELKDRLRTIIKDEIIPYLKEKSNVEFPDLKFNIIPTDNGESIEFYYPSSINGETSYVLEYVLIEFGARNSTEPSEEHAIEAILKKCSKANDLVLPSTQITTLSPIRTFWEKATLIHVECHRKRLRSNPDRLSRHWYDLAMLADTWVGEKALEQLDILTDVITHKKAFYHASYANYDDCLSGIFRLLPDKEDIHNLANDFENMRDSGMFSIEPMEFDHLAASIKSLEKNINTTINNFTHTSISQ